MAISETTLKDTILMMIDEQNKKGGLLGKKLEAVVVDPASNWPLFAEKAAQLLEKDKVAVVFGCWTSVSRKSVLPVFEKNNGLLFYPVQYEGEESSKNVIYTGAAPNQQAIPAVDYLMKDVGREAVGARRHRLRLSAHDEQDPRGLPPVQGRDAGGHLDQLHAVRPLRLADARRGHQAVRSAGKKTAVVSTINGDANVPFYKELGNQKISAEDIPVVAFSVGEEELSGLDTKPLVGHLAAWNYFQSISTPANKAFIDQWKTYIKNPKRTTNDPMEAHYIGFNLWVKAVEKAGTTDVEKVLAALPGLETPNLTGGIAQACCPTTTSPSRSTSARSGRTASSTSSGRPTGTVPGDAWSDFLPGSKDIDSRLGDAEVRELQHDDQGVLGTKLQVSADPDAAGSGCRWLLLAVALLVAAASRSARSHRTTASSPTLGELREASFLDKEAIAERLTRAAIRAPGRC